MLLDFKNDQVTQSYHYFFTSLLIVYTIYTLFDYFKKMDFVIFYQYFNDNYFFFEFNFHLVYNSVSIFHYLYLEYGFILILIGLLLLISLVGSIVLIDKSSYNAGKNDV
jgi:hypothetical protein